MYNNHMNITQLNLRIIASIIVIGAVSMLGLRER